MDLRVSKLRAALVDNVARDLRYACRSFLRTPLVALTIVTTVGLGLGLVAVVFTLLNAYLFQADDVRNPYELFAVQRQASANAAPQGFTRLEYEALVRDTAFLSDAFATTPEIDARIDGSRQEGRLVTGNFFEVLGVGAARGRALTPQDDVPGAPAALVLSHHAWSQYFASDPGVVARTVRVNETPFDVVGVMPEGFRGLRPVAAPEFWAPLSRLGAFRPGDRRDEGSAALEIIGRLAPDLTADQALAQLLTWDSLREAERAPAPSDRQQASCSSRGLERSRCRPKSWRSPCRSSSRSASSWSSGARTSPTYCSHARSRASASSASDWRSGHRGGASSCSY